MMIKEICLEVGSKMAQYLDLQEDILLNLHDAKTVHNALFFAMTTNLLILIKEHGKSVDDLCTALKGLAEELDAVFEESKTQNSQREETIH